MRFPTIPCVMAELRDINERMTPNDDCPECEGDGKSMNAEGNLDGGECESCGGSGTVPAKEGCDVRLQVYEDGSWAVRSGDASYDQDHRGYIGASSVPGHDRKFDARAIARDLLDQCREAKASR